MARNWLLLCAVGLSAIAVPPGLVGHSPVAAQQTDPDDGGTDTADDDGDVPDPDDSGSDPGDAPDDPDPGSSDPADSDPGSSDPAESDPGGSDPGDSDPGGSDAGDGGGADAGDGGGADAGGAAGDDDNDAPGSPAGGGSDDDGDDGSGAAAGPSTGDDDDDDGAAAPAGGAASGGGDDDDDGAASSASGGADDDDAPGGPGSSPDDDDDDNDSGGDNGGDDDGGAGGGTIIGGSEEDDDDRIRLDARDGIEVDRDGFRYRKNEFVALDLQPADIAQLQAEGFRIIETARLDSMGATISLIKSPARRSDQDMLSQIEEIAGSASISFNYLFDTSTARIRKTPKIAVAQRAACGCDIGLIDTGVATKAGAFKHVEVQQKAFNGAAVVPRGHGTGVAHLFAGTQAAAGKKRTRVFVGDIFGTDRAHAGSSFVLVKALDWMGQMKVPVINVSLAGPKSPAVAKAVEALTRKGHIVVAAAGNDGPAAPPVFPGAYPGVVAVTAVDAQSRIYRYANRGTYIDVSSIGVEVPAIDNGGVPVVATGTSFASPVVARRLARAMTKPDVAAAKAAIAAVERSARDLGAPGRDNVYGHGLVSD